MTPPRADGRPKNKTLSEIQPRNGVRIDFTDEAATSAARAALCKSDASSISTTQAMSSDSDQTGQGAATQTGETPAFRFFTVDNPEKFRERKGMRENRQHVMRDYLSKERQRPESTDIRVRGSARSRNKRRRSTPPISDATSHSPITQPLRQQRSSTSPQRKTRRVGSRAPLLPSSDDGNGEVPRHETTAQDVSRGCSAHERRLTSLRSPSPISRLGWQLNPFHVFARFEDTSLDTELLQYHRKRHFTNDASALSCYAKWVRILGSENYAPLSTLCYSSAYDDRMFRGTRRPHERSWHESMDCMKVRQEIVVLVNRAMRDPKKQTSDATILAVMNLVYSEIMGYEQKWLIAHRSGLHDLVARRGGLDKLGGGGQLSCVVAIAMYLSSALRETRPLQHYVSWADARITNPEESSTDLVQSPLYARQSGFTTISGALLPDENLELIEMSRLITQCFMVCVSTDPSALCKLSPSKTGLTSYQSDPDEAMYDILSQIRSAKDAEQTRISFATQNAKYTYEAIRLTSCLYAYALAHKVPFSAAANALSPQRPAFHALIKNALAKTNMSECWGPLIGILLWITLVGGASANPASADITSHGLGDEEADEDRRWLAAVSVRCCILLNSGDCGDQVLDTLRRFVEIESALAHAQAHDETQSYRGSSSSLLGSPGSTAVVVGFPSRRNFDHSSASPESQSWSGCDYRLRTVPVTNSGVGFAMASSAIS